MRSKNMPKQCKANSNGSKMYGTSKWQSNVLSVFFMPRNTTITWKNTQQQLFAIKEDITNEVKEALGASRHGFKATIQ
ncbi:hypothetical protein JTB14_025548 [Gonioctena quinquepunctata]|nr:hypothetical protein JTB14_025548 [Gonioctena quinquepunctata]